MTVSPINSAILGWN